MQLQSLLIQKELLADKGFDPIFGARPLRREIQDRIEDKLSEEFLSGKFGPGDTIKADVEDDDIVLTVVSSVAKIETQILVLLTV